VSGVYDSLGSYFGVAGGTGSPGKAGGGGYSSDQVTGGAQQTGDTQSLSASSGSGWISAAASASSTDKSNFSTPFTQGFGGITNNQIIESPGAVNNAATQPITGPPITGGPSAPGSLFGLDPVALLLVAAGLFLLVKAFRG
jgi:hypothetical protein